MKKYRQNIDYIKLFQNDSSVPEGLKAEMLKHSKNLEFEEASAIKYRIDSINSLLTEQKYPLQVLIRGM